MITRNQMIINCNNLVSHVQQCEDCTSKLIDYFNYLSTSKAGSTTSKKKAKSSKLNGMKGGRPRSKK